ncbi:MAG: hypothetical protein V5A72_01145, partial [Candidatus Nanohaloarchaea archaeon]
MIEKYSYKGSENTGFYTLATNEYVLVPPDHTQADFFDKKIVETKLNRTNLVGLFAAGNSNCLIVPEEISEIEKERLEESGIEFTVLESNYNALGNLILCNDKGALISEKISEYKDEVADALNVDVKIADIKGLNPGVSGIVNSNGGVIHRDAS